MPPLATVAAQTAATSERRRTDADLPEGDPRLAREYCLNIADAAVDARFAWQKKTLADLEQEIAKRVELLEAKTAEDGELLVRGEFVMLGYRNAPEKTADFFIIPKIIE